MISAEHIQWQIAVVPVVAMEKARFLPSVHRRIGGVQVQHDLARRPGMRFQKEIDQQGVERFGGIADFVVAFRGRGPAVSVPTGSACSCRQGRVQVAPPGQHPKKRVVRSSS